VDKTLPARPNLEHLKHQAKTLLAGLKDRDAAATQAFIEHLPAAKKMKPAAVRAAGFRLADAQSVVARQSGFASWPALARHVQQLRALEGEWQFTSLVADGNAMPGSALAHTRILIDGDRFRTESPEANYEGVFTIDADAKPSHIDIEFVEGPEAGNWCYGLYDLDGDRLTLCLSLLADGSRPKTFASKTGSGHALEKLRRVSAARPAGVTGGTPQPMKKSAPPDREDPSAFDIEITPLLRRLEGDWIPVELIMDGKPMPAEWLAYGSRTMVGNEVKVVFGGQTMLHAKVRIDERATPIAVDYLNLHKAHAGIVTRGIMDWVGDEVRFVMAGPGEPRPPSFDTPSSTATLSRWRRR
jgi:uncharacterized protein (TIGR03067 family)